VTVTLESTQDLPCILDRESTVREWLADRRGSQVIAPLLQQAEAMSRRTFGAEGGTEGLGMQIMDMFADMPLLNMLEFQANALPEPPDKLVDRMLRQARELP